MQFLQQLYGDDILNISLKIIFEFLSYFLAGLLGATIREIFIEEDIKLSRTLPSSLITAVLLFVGASYFKEHEITGRLVFGLGVLLGVYIPNSKKILKEGKVFKFIIKLFSKKAYDLISDIEEDDKKDIEEDDKKEKPL
jgi:TctA family transporter